MAGKEFRVYVAGQPTKAEFFSRFAAADYALNECRVFRKSTIITHMASGKVIGGYEYDMVKEEAQGYLFE